MDPTVPSWSSSRNSLSKDSSRAAVSASCLEHASMDCCRNCAICPFNSSLSPFKASISRFKFSFSCLCASASLCVASLIIFIDAMISTLRYTKRDSEEIVTVNVRRAQMKWYRRSTLLFIFSIIYALRWLSRMSARVEEKCCAREDLTRRTSSSGPSAVTHMFKIHSLCETDNRVKLHHKSCIQ